MSLLPFFRRWFEGVVSALVHTLVAELPLPHSHGDLNRVTAFILHQHARMPDFLRLPLMTLTIGVDLSGFFFHGRSFRGQTPPQRKALVGWWKSVSFGPCRDLIRFYESLATIAWTDASLPSLPRRARRPKTPAHHSAGKLEATATIIGSGPGGAITAALLAEHGIKTLLIEEGPGETDAPCPAFTVEEMLQKYRNGGLTPAMGQPKIAYVEGSCLGGGSEVNSGLYHRTPAPIIEHWRQAFDLRVDLQELLPHFEACERDLSVGYFPGRSPAAALKLQQGADVLGWHCQEIPRWFRYDAPATPGGTPVGQRQSMSQTYLKRFAAAGGVTLDRTRGESIRRVGNAWEIGARGPAGESLSVASRNVIVSAGAVRTPALLQRSRIPGNFGENLQLHPTVKVVALFPEEINSPSMGVPAHQVKEFAPAFSFGCAISTQPYIAMAMLDHPSHLHLVASHWRQMAIYYAMIVPQGRGRVRALPGFRDPLVTFQTSEDDRRLLATALQHLCRLLFAAGAAQLFPSVTNFPSLSGPEQLTKIPAVLPKDRSNLMTIHLASTCPMGERRSICPVDSFGQVVGQEGLYVADASLLPSAPGVNPQGSIMAFVRRNAFHFIDRHGS